jgi:large subunit ribosomal protein L13
VPNSRNVSTYTPKPGEIARTWHVIDAQDVVLGRLATQAATLLRGKHKPQFAQHVDTGDFVVIINAEKVAVAPSKLGEFRYRHSGYPGGLSRRTVGELLETKPERVVELAVRGMLPKSTLGRRQLKKLKVYAGPEHPHSAQKPQPFEIKQVAQ